MLLGGWMGCLFVSELVESAVDTQGGGLYRWMNGEYRCAILASCRLSSASSRRVEGML